MTVPTLALVPLTGAVVLLAVVRPSWALVLPLVFHAAYQIRLTIPLGELALPTTLLEVLVGVAVATACVRAGTRRQVREQYRVALHSLPRGVIVLGLLFLVAATVSAAIAPHPRTSWGQWKAFVVEPMVYVVVMLPTLHDLGGRRRVVGALLLGGLVSASLALVVGARTMDFGRLAGIYDVPNSLALVLAPLTAFAAVIALSPGGHLRRLARWSLAPMVPALLLTQSLGGLLAAALSFGSYLHHPFVRRIRVRQAVLAGSTLFVVLMGLILQRETGKLAHAFTATSPLHARLQIWQVSAALLREHPFLGTGLGTFEPTYQEKLHEVLSGSRLVIGNWELGIARAAPALEWLVRDPHNVFLSFWLNTGLLGLVAMGGLLLKVLRAAWQRPRGSSGSSREDPGQPLRAAAGAALVTLLIFGLVDVPYLKNDLSLLWWTFAALAVTTATAREAL